MAQKGMVERVEELALCLKRFVGSALWAVLQPHFRRWAVYTIAVCTFFSLMSVIFLGSTSGLISVH